MSTCSIHLLFTINDQNIHTVCTYIEVNTSIGIVQFKVVYIHAGEYMYVLI